MGAWGTGILQNDTTADIWVEFKELYNRGLTSKEIRIKLEKDYKPNRDKEYYAEIWTGIAYGQWMCSDIEDYTNKKLSEATQLKWQTLWLDDKKQLQERINVISKFIDKIKTPKPHPIKRKKIIDSPSIYKKGDIIGLKIDAENYLAGIVVDHSDHPTHGDCTIILLDLTFKEKPTQKEILNSNILYLDVGGDYFYHRGFFRAMFDAKNMKRKAKDTTKVGELKVADHLSLGSGIRIGDWNKVPLLYFEQQHYLINNETDKPFNVTVNDLLKLKKQLQDKLIDWDKKMFQEDLERRRKKST